MALLDDDWGFDQRIDEEEQGNGCFGFPGNQAAGCFYGQWDSDQLEFQLPNTSTSGSTPGADGSAAPELDHESMAVIDPDGAIGPRRRRRAKGRKTQEDLESQRMTHIAVERNRRKQMNEYLSVIRSLMPESYSQRGDQASIVGGAINFVKELEQQLEALSVQPHEETDRHRIAYPCYGNVAMDESAAGLGQSSATAGVEVNLVDCHANIKIRSAKRPRQLLQLVKGLQSIGLSVLHLNTNTVERSVLYSLSVKVEDECKLTSGDEIAAAVYQILGSI